MGRLSLDPTSTANAEMGSPQLVWLAPPPLRQCHLDAETDQADPQAIGTSSGLWLASDP